MPKPSADGPLIHPTAEVETCTFCRFTRVEARSGLAATALGDYS